MWKNPVMAWMVLAIVLSGLGTICTSLAALWQHPPSAGSSGSGGSADVTPPAPGPLPPPAAH
jgi:hypothetical protein